MSLSTSSNTFLDPLCSVFLALPDDLRDSLQGASHCKNPLPRKKPFLVPEIEPAGRIFEISDWNSIRGKCETCGKSLSLLMCLKF